MTTPMRVTERSVAATTLAGLQENLSRLAGLQRQLSSGRLISQPSDSPGGTVSAMQIRDDLGRMQQYIRNANDGKAWLGTVDGALNGSVTQLQQVRDLVLQGMSAGSADSPAVREVLARQVDNLRVSLLGLANTVHLDRPVFGGTTAGGAAYDPNGSYVGDSGTVLRTVAASTKVKVDVSGPATFGDGPGSVFDVLSTISSDLRANPANLATDLSDLDAVTEKLKAAEADAGVRYNQLDQLGQTASDRIITLRSQLSELEDIDLPLTITELQLQQTAYQAALGATAKVIQPSLVDFLR
ncbi:MAG: flagellar hook protein [Actinobacteria bacterium]|nr:flagellar hook protein [Actinomycetota bacterium]